MVAPMTVATRGHSARGRRDANEPLIIAALEAVGCRVQKLNDRDAPDLLVSVDNRNILLEVKLPAGAKGGTAHSELSPGQFSWHRRWLGPVHVVRTVDDALRAVGVRT